MKKQLLTLSVTLFVLFFKTAFSVSCSPTGELFGYVKDSITGEPLPFANVLIRSGETVINGAQTDADGSYKVSGITPGNYMAEASYTNYATKAVRGVVISAEKTSRLDFDLSGNMLGPIVIIEQIIPLIDPQEVSTTYTLTDDQIKVMPTRDIIDMVPLAAGVYQLDAGHPVNIRGSRDDATQYIIDGVKITGQPDIPVGAINQVTVFTGGVPAAYGDATGGFVIITTKSYFGRRFD